MLFLKTSLVGGCYALDEHSTCDALWDTPPREEKEKKYKNKKAS